MHLETLIASTTAMLLATRAAARVARRNLLPVASNDVAHRSERAHMLIRVQMTATLVHHSVHAVVERPFRVGRINTTTRSVVARTT